MRRATYYASMNLWGFASVMLALLFITIGAATPHRGRRASVDLPHAVNDVSQPGALRDDAIHIVVARDGVVYYGNVRVRTEDLANAIRMSLRVGAERKIYLEADMRANYHWYVAPVLDQIQLAGVSNVAFLTIKSANPIH